MAQRPTIRTYLAFAAVALIGGGNAVSIKIGLVELAPFWGGAIRFIVASALLFGLCAVLKIPLPRGRALAGAAIFGVLNFGLAFSFGYFALTEISAGTAQVTIALTPMLVILLSALHGVEWLTARAIVGALIAFGGSAIIFGESLRAASALALIAMGLGVLCFAEAAVAIKRFPRVGPLMENAVGQGVGGAMLLALSAATGEAWIIPVQGPTWASLGFLILLGSMALFGLYVYVIESWTATAATYSLLIMPVVTVAAAALLLGETITTRFFVGGATILIGLLIGIRRA